MRSSLRLVLAAVAAALGCQAAPEPTAPLRLDSDPEMTCLVVAECRMENRATFGNTVLKLDGGSVLHVESGTRWYVLEREGLLIFDGLPPGTYVVDYLKAEPGIEEARAAGERSTEVGTRSYTLPHTPGFEFAVERGAPCYYGPITAQNARRRGEVWIDSHVEPSAEGRAWRKVLALYPDSPWVPAVRARLFEIAGD